MREAAFSKQNHQKWKAFEQKIALGNIANPDEMADMFIEVTDDLAFAQTYYPKSKTTVYLNQLAVKAHQTIYKNKKEKKGRLKWFWKVEVPLAIQVAHKPMLLALVVFLLAIVAGVVSTLYDEDFPRYLLGDGYVNMTLENIAKGDPLGVYGRDSQVNMFFYITINNIMVALKAIGFGIVFSILTIVDMLNNGVMVGVFFTFLYTEGQLGIAFLSVFIHGVIELASIVIAGGAGIMLGNSFMFPGTYKRIDSLKRGARNAAIIAVGLVPLFIVAGFLESFITRYYQNIWVGILTIGITFPFIIWYYIILPKRVFKRYGRKD